MRYEHAPTPSSRVRLVPLSAHCRYSCHPYAEVRMRPAALAIVLAAAVGCGNGSTPPGDGTVGPNAVPGSGGTPATGTDGGTSVSGGSTSDDGGMGGGSDGGGTGGGGTGVYAGTGG